jgi:hypothetical protein
MVAMPSTKRFATRDKIAGATATNSSSVAKVGMRERRDRTNPDHPLSQGIGVLEHPDEY